MTETKCFRDAFRDQLYELSEHGDINSLNLDSNLLDLKTFIHRTFWMNKDCLTLIQI